MSLPWITPRWSAASIALTATSKALGSWASRVPSSALDAEPCSTGFWRGMRLVLHLHVRVERHEAAVLELRQRVDLGQRHVAILEQAASRARIGVRRLSADPVTPAAAIACLAWKSENGSRFEK